MADEKKMEVIETATKKNLQKGLVQAVKIGDFKKSARIRLSLKNLK